MPGGASSSSSSPDSPNPYANGVTYRWRSLKRLALHMNRLTELPDLSCAASCLTTLQLNNNLLTQLPRLGPAKALTLLDASHNAIARLPHAQQLRQLTSLTNLSLKNNKLVTLPPDIGACGVLETLNLESNGSLTSLPEEVGDVTSLKVLLLKDSGVCVLPMSLAELTCLTRVSLERTPLAAALSGKPGASAATVTTSPRPEAGGGGGGGGLSSPRGQQAAAMAALTPQQLAAQQALIRGVTQQCNLNGGWCKL